MKNKETKKQQPTEASNDFYTLLCPVSRNYLRRGDKVRMKDGEILTVRSLEFREFCAEEKVGYIPKKDIDTVMELNGAQRFGGMLSVFIYGLKEQNYDRK